MTEPLILVVTLKGRPYGLPRGRHVPGRRRPVSMTGKPLAYARALERAAHAVVLAVGESAVQQAFAGKALALSALWVFPTPVRERWGRPHTHTPDKDNLEKLLADALMRAGALGGDDSRIAVGVTSKQWGPTGWLAAQVQAVTRADRRAVRKEIKDNLSMPPPWLIG